MEAHYSKEVAAAPEAAWSTIGGFCGIASWHPAVTACEEQTKDGADLSDVDPGGRREAG